MRSAVPLALAAALVAGSSAAQSQSPEESQPPQEEESWLPERMERALREMMEDMKPAFDEALDYMRSFGAIDDPRHYEMPEVLPDGDIIIRRREDAPPFRPDAPAEPEAPGEDPPHDPEEGIRT